MRKLGLALALAVLGFAPAQAQNVSWPPPAGTIAFLCVYNAVAPTMTTGSAGYVQCDVNGQVKTTGGGGAATTVQGNVSDASSGIAATSTNVPTVAYNYIWNGSTWDQAGGLAVGTAGVPATQVITLQGISGGTPVPIQGPSTGGGFPTAATAITNSATGTTAATAATLAAAASKTTYICGFSIDSDATVGLGGATATIAGVISGTMTFIQGVGVAPAVATTSKTFNPCIPSSTTNTAIVVTSAAASTGGNTSVNAWGYQQ